MNWNWPSRTLGDLVSLQRGHDLTEEQRKPGIVPVVGSAGQNGTHSQARATGPGVTLGRSGASIGKVTYIPTDYWPHNTCIYVTDFKGNNPRFVAYLLSTLDLAQLNSGAAQPSLNRNFVYGVKLRYPGRNEQDRIADILSAYDDLIENNRRRVALLEQAARELYREWFVRLRFPGHEHVKIIDGVPEGWSRQTLADLTTKIGSGATPRGGEASYKTSGITLFRSQNIYDYCFEPAGLAFIDEEQAKALSNVEVQFGDVLINITGASVGRCCLAPRRFLPGRVNQHVLIVRADPTRVTPQFLLHAINSPENKGLLLNIARAGGATREALTKDDMSGFFIQVPTPDLIEGFDGQVASMFAQQEALAHQNESLARARDLLLPRLMNGSIAV